VLAYAECSPPSCPWHLPHDISTRLQTKSACSTYVRALVSELGHQPALASVGPAAHLERELGLGSLERVELLLRIEQAFGTRLDDRVLAEAETVQDLISRASVAVNGLPLSRQRVPVSRRVLLKSPPANRGWAPHRANDSRRVAY